MRTGIGGYDSSCNRIIIKPETTETNKEFLRFSPLLFDGDIWEYMMNSSCRMDVPLMLQDIIPSRVPVAMTPRFWTFNYSVYGLNVQKTSGFVQDIWPGHWTILASSQDFVASFPACCRKSEDSLRFVHADVNGVLHWGKKTKENFWHRSEGYIILRWPLHSKRKALSLCLAPCNMFDMWISTDVYLQDLKRLVGQRSLSSQLLAEAETQHQ